MRSLGGAVVAGVRGYLQAGLSEWLGTGRVDSGFAIDRIGTQSPDRRSLPGKLPQAAYGTGGLSEWYSS